MLINVERMSLLKEYMRLYNLLLFKCPYNKCKCKMLMNYLCKQEFMPNYCWWTNHGKELPQFPPMVIEGSYYRNGEQWE
ncbi:hypothetical protein CR513_52482, partial [Mucuna pruriens]